MAKSTNYYVRKAHRWLGIILAVQFLAWTISGLYFSWTDIDEIHGDHLRAYPEEVLIFSDLQVLAPNELELEKTGISTLSSVELIHTVDGVSYLVEGKSEKGEMIRAAFNGTSGELRKDISEKYAREIGEQFYLGDGSINGTQYLTETSQDHEYRGGDLPAWQVTFDDEEQTRFYLSAITGKLQKVRTTSWRWFDWLWMTHIMDYDERADINNLLLRIFSVAGLVTVLSGLVLFGYTSPALKRRKGRDAA
jgi:uncharacterized protein YpmB